MSAILPIGSDPRRDARQRTEQWLEGVYQKELGRKLGDEGRAYWTADIHDRGQTREQVLANIRRSNEYKGYQRGREEEKELVKPFEPPVVPLPEVPKPRPPIHGDPERPRRPRRRPIEGGDGDGWRWGRNRRKYDIHDGISAAASAGNRMTDDYYARFLPEIRNEVLLGTAEIGAADRYHGERYLGTPTDYTDPDDLFKKYRNDDDDESESSVTDELERRIQELEDRYSIV